MLLYSANSLVLVWVAGQLSGRLRQFTRKQSEAAWSIAGGDAESWTEVEVSL